MKKFRLIAAVSILTILSCSSAPVRPVNIKTGDYSYTIEYLKWLIPREMAGRNIKGLSIALVDDQKVIWSDGFGWAVKSRGIRATRDTLYQIGSISKVFTAMAAMKLVEDGRLDIDKPVKHYLKGLIYKKRFRALEPTVRHLMYHHSGLPTDNYPMLFTKKKEIPFTKMITTLAGEYAAYPPDHVFSYCNLCVTLEGHIIQNIAKEDFTAYTDKILFRAMRMNRTSFSNMPKKPLLMSRGYHGRNESEHYRVNLLPAGSMISSVTDLAEFMKTVFAGGRHGDKQILSPVMLNKMFRVQNRHVPLDLDLKFGLGWFLSGMEIIGGRKLNYKGTVAWHSGGTILFNSILAVLPEMKLGVVVLTNTSSGSPSTVRIAVEALNRAIEAKTGKLKAYQKEEKPRSIVIDSPELKSHEGYYATEFVGAVKIIVSGNRAEMEIAGSPLKMNFVTGKKFNLTFLGFIPELLKNKYFSFKNIAGKKVLVSHVFGKEYLMGVKVEEKPVPEEWRRRAGLYVQVDPGDTVPLFEGVEIRCRDRMLFIYLKIRGKTKKIPYFILQPLSDTEAVIAGLGQNMGQTVRVESRNGREMIKFSGIRLVKK